ncbi:dihydrofolate reductase family protein [Demequina pelophila]|uniref:dihydrofolate reductase family protein n=1 Tax=Demequina pelophila TaxID=1638984 RepID=UPI0007864230|nr:dihydrofolate reductase family protein [Demequina pelophila]
MGRLIVEQMVSADGFAADARGSVARLAPPFDDGQSALSQLRMLEEVDAILMGRRTYELFADYWPRQPTTGGDPVAGPINALPKHVVSATLRRAPWGDYASARVEVGSPRDIARRLTTQYQGDVIVWGSLTLVGALLQQKEVDHLRLRVVPVLLGEGLRLAPGLRDDRRLTLVGVEWHPSGHTTLAYDVG